jgi:hypothetical protein
MLLQVSEYERLIFIQEDRSIESKETQNLSWMGSQIPDGGRIVEIGSYKGASALAMALGAQSASKKFTIYCIDLWMKGTGITRTKYYKDKTFLAFVHNMQNFGVFDYTVPIMGWSKNAYKIWRGPIDLLFIDGKHNYKNASYDATHWGKRVAEGGRIAFHDYGGKWDGVTQAVDQLFATGQWENVNRVQSVWSATKKVAPILKTEEI